MKIKFSHKTKIYIALFFLLINLSLCQNLNSNSSNTLKEEEDHPCEKKTNILLSHFLNNTEIPLEYSDFYKFALNTGTGINDWGDYAGCKSMNMSRYFLVVYLIKTGEGNATTPVSFGLCYFKECDAAYMNNARDDIAYLLKKYKGIDIQPQNLYFKEPDNQLTDYRDRMMAGFIVVMSILGVFVILSLIQCYIKHKPFRSTLIYDSEEEKMSQKSFLENERNLVGQTREFMKKALKFFDFGANLTKILQVNNINKTYSHLRIFDGIRFLSTFWVVFGHTFHTPTFMLTWKNATDMFDLAKTWRFTILLGAFYAVDVFFYISGFLLYFGLQKYFDREINRCKIFFFAVLNRYMRLLPLYLFTIFGITYIMPFLGSGPLYERVEGINKSCSKYFWHNLLYINNLFKYEGPEGGMCAGHTWYLANDIQFFFLFTVIFLFLNKHRVIRAIIFILLFIGSCAVSIYEVFHYEYYYLDLGHPEHLNTLGTYFDNYYIKPWIRVCPYILGLLFCEFFLETPLYLKDYKKATADDGKRLNIIRGINNYLIESDIASFILFLFSIIVMSSTFITILITNRYDLPIVYHAMFHTFNKILFVFALGCIVHLTFLGKFNFIRKVFSFKVFSGISRISYGIYLLHLYMLFYFFFTLNMVPYLKMADCTLIAVGITVITTILSLVFTTLIESPIINLLKTLIEKERSLKPKVLHVKIKDTSL